MDQKEIRKWRKIRWGTTIFYLLFLTILALVPIHIGIDEIVYFTGYLIIFILTFIPFIMTLNRPYTKRKRGIPSEPDQKEEKKVSSRPREMEFNDHIDMWIILVLIIPVELLTVIPLMLTADLIMYAIALGTIVFFALIIAIFYRLRIHADQEQVKFHYGPIGKTLLIRDIRSAKAVEVHALKDYLGWGIRSGTDGSLGYISNSKKGIRIETISNKVYVVTCNRPDGLEELVNWLKWH